MSSDVDPLGSHCYLWHKPIISIFRTFLPKVIESSFDAKLFLFAKCARAYETWKQWQWIRRKLCRKHKIWGESWLYLRPYLKVFSVFNVLQTGRVFLLEIDLEIVKFIKKKFSSGSLENAKIVGMDQITCKNCHKSSWMPVNKIFLLAIVRSNSPLSLYSFQWNQTTMRWSWVSKAYHFL